MRPLNFSLSSRASPITWLYPSRMSNHYYRLVLNIRRTQHWGRSLCWDPWLQFSGLCQGKPCRQGWLQDQMGQLEQQELAFVWHPGTIQNVWATVPAPQYFWSWRHLRGNEMPEALHLQRLQIHWWKWDNVFWSKRLHLFFVGCFEWHHNWTRGSHLSIGLPDRRHRRHPRPLCRFLFYDHLGWSWGFSGLGQRHVTLHASKVKKDCTEIMME